MAACTVWVVPFVPRTLAAWLTNAESRFMFVRFFTYLAYTR